MCLRSNDAQLGIDNFQNIVVRWKKARSHYVSSKQKSFQEFHLKEDEVSDGSDTMFLLSKSFMRSLLAYMVK